MTRRAMVTSILCGGLIVLALARPTMLRGQEPPHSHAGGHQLGSVSFPNSGAAAAQEPFLRGLALLHSFEYVDAGEAFRVAQTADPEFALAYWAEALTHTQLLWGVDDTSGAREALRRLAPASAARLDLAPTPGERAWGGAVEAFYADAETPVRARAFADSLRMLTARDTTDLEAAAFASLALQMAVHVGAFDEEESSAARDEAIALAARVFRANPRHPGAAHYLIHAFDSPELAPRGLEAARAYAGIAPDSEHALHMPSHIFVQVGAWEDAARSNERAWAASRAWVTRRGESPASLDFHSLQWLQYAYLQAGRWRAAAALVDSARVALSGADVSAASPDARHAVSEMQFAWAAVTGDWRDWAPPAHPDTAPFSSPRARTFARYAAYQAAAAAAMRGDAASAEATARRFRDAASSEDGRGSRWLEFAALQLDALAARARGEGEAALEGLQRAAAAEEELPPIGPPLYLPTHELLGSALLEAGRAGEAARAFEAGLARRPNRSVALLGLARSRTTLGDRPGAAAAYARLAENWRSADEDVPALQEVRRGSAGGEESRDASAGGSGDRSASPDGDTEAAGPAAGSTAR